MAGVGPKPPRVDDPNVDSMLVAWIRVNVQSPLTLSWAGINAVAIDQRTTYNNVTAGVSDGPADQQFALAQTQIDPATFHSMWTCRDWVSSYGQRWTICRCCKGRCPLSYLTRRLAW